MKIEHLQHKFGGRITEITQAEHATTKGVAYWFLRGNVEWRDGSKSQAAEIGPHQLCYDGDNSEAKKELDVVLAKLNEHLQSKGMWHEPKRVRGQYVHWSPAEKQAVTLF